MATKVELGGQIGQVLGQATLAELEDVNGQEGVNIQVIQIYTGLALEHHCLVARAGDEFLLSVVPSIKHSMAGTDKTGWYARGVIQLSKH